MKRLLDLTPGDLEKVAVWLYQGETDETASVRATDRRELRAVNPEVFLARTQFVLANGSQHIGYCSPGDDNTLDYLQPVIVTADGPVYFWFETPPTREFLSSQWRRLGVGAEEIFPVHFRCTVPVEGEFVLGVITADDLTGAA